MYSGMNVDIHATAIRDINWPWRCTMYAIQQYDTRL